MVLFANYIQRSCNLDRMLRDSKKVDGRRMALWESTDRSPLTVLLAFLCFFSDVMLAKQATARVYFGCFASVAVAFGTAVEKRLFNESVEDLDLLDLSPGMLSVMGTVIELSLLGMPYIVQVVVRYTILSCSLGIAVLLALEYYSSGDISKLWKWKRGNSIDKVNLLRNTTTASSRRRIVSHTKGEFHKKYELGKKLGSGSFGTVLLAMDKTKYTTDHDEKCRCFAAKCIDRRKLTSYDENQVYNEVEILQLVKGRNKYIVEICGYYEESDFFYLVLEYMRGGELFDRIQKKEKYFEKDAKIVVRTIANALSFLHSLDIVHRDLKPENILMESDASNSRIKLADFGFARRVGKGCTTACGTPSYVAPEIVNGKGYGVEVDIWALGVIVYILLSGCPPFYDKHRPKLLRSIRNCQFSFPEPYFSLVSFQARDFIKKCLTADVRQRITADEILLHPWLATSSFQRRKTLTSVQSERLDDVYAETDEPELSQAQGLIKLFNARQRLRAGILAAIAANRITTIAASLRASQK